MTTKLHDGRKCGQMSGSIKQSANAPLKVSQLEADIKSGKIDTVVVGVTHMQGRLQLIF